MNITKINNMHAAIELAEKLAYPSQYDKKEVNITYSNLDGREVTVTVPSIFLRGYNSNMRSASFKKSSDLFEQLNIPIEKFAREGFIYVGTSGSLDRVQCVRCKGVLSKFVKNDDPAADHQTYFPRCQVEMGHVPIELNIPKRQPSSVASEKGQCSGIVNEFTGKVNEQNQKINVSERSAVACDEERMREIKKAKLSMETSLEVSVKPKGGSYGDLELTEDLNGPCCSGRSTRVVNEQQKVSDHSHFCDDDHVTQEELARRMEAKSWTRSTESLAAFSQAPTQAPTQAPSNVCNIDARSIPFDEYKAKAKLFLKKNRCDLVSNIAKDKLYTYLDLLLSGTGGIPGNSQPIDEGMRAQILSELTTNGLNSGIRALLNTCGTRSQAGLYLMLIMYQGKVLSENPNYPYPDFVEGLLKLGIGKVTEAEAM
ncbi:MAG: hypothetical protein QS748_11245 [Candidatus Endonucleobacter bathymodioli]|uniref:Uncharacterized protein n=1 Tax=Candidatus Endonucleibacter bathymodioli TaxID=539814 RepID=A0AA90P271_9GAMM|nr:hypothetical protein [Candidatus Endonucleobacter bathymodioli]